ncbi:MAG: ABC transporter ATP-binding protein [Burkholderiales bacterium]|nr:ABC transporter ATP-binding protein [Burkholderiales bacterium]MDE2276886.1 ABC transporter ATP-binding protein [Burkholderiales bacterium]
MPAATVPLLQARGLALQAGPRRLLQGLDLQLERGQVWALLGPNGSGKTTLLHALAGLGPVAAGEVQVGGRPIAAWPAGALACWRGLLPQTLHDAFSARVIELVLQGRHPHLSRWAWEGAEDRAAALAALRAVELEGLAGRDVTTLSGGERQRVAIAALLAQDPLLLLLDEPVAHLDLRHQVTLLQHLRRLAAEQGKAVLLSIHDLNLAHRYCTHALVLAGDGGRPLPGAVDAAMAEAPLGAAFGHPVRRVALADRVVFVAG